MERLTFEGLCEILQALGEREEMCVRWRDAVGQTDDGRAYWMSRLAAVERTREEVKSLHYSPDPTPADEKEVDEIDIADVGPHAGAAVREWVETDYPF